MVLSMTGFGKASGAVDDLSISIEVRTLNSRYLDMNLKIPGLLREKEMEIRSTLSDLIVRGKVELNVEVTFGEKVQSTINKNAFSAYAKQIGKLADENNLEVKNLLSVVLKIPDVIQPSRLDINEKQWNQIASFINEALTNVQDFREKEGSSLAADLSKRTKEIRTLLAKVKEEDPKRQEMIKSRISQKIHDVIDEEKIDHNRLEQEMIYYIEKLDVTEELVRLESHCQHFLDTLSEEGNSKGKKLAFIGQEMGREINTIGSKASDAGIQKTVVLMKEQLEQIKEQVNNIL